jgi:hypothetical protein
MACHPIIVITSTFPRSDRIKTREISLAHSTPRQTTESAKRTWPKTTSDSVDPSNGRPVSRKTPVIVRSLIDRLSWSGISGLHCQVRFSLLYTASNQRRPVLTRRSFHGKPTIGLRWIGHRRSKCQTPSSLHPSLNITARAELHIPLNQLLPVPSPFASSVHPHPPPPRQSIVRLVILGGRYDEERLTDPIVRSARVQ